MILLCSLSQTPEASLMKGPFLPQSCPPYIATLALQMACDIPRSDVAIRESLD